jgi:excisionase family DNA binding protein
MMSEATQSSGGLRALTIEEFCAKFGVGRTTAYREISAGRLKMVKVGKRSLVRIDDAEQWLAVLPAA